MSSPHRLAITEREDLEKTLRTEKRILPRGLLVGWASNENLSTR